MSDKKPRVRWIRSENEIPAAIGFFLFFFFFSVAHFHNYSLLIFLHTWTHKNSFTLAQPYAFTARYFKEVLIWDACHFCRIIMLTLSKQVSNELKTLTDTIKLTTTTTTTPMDTLPMAATVCSVTLKSVKRMDSIAPDLLTQFTVIKIILIRRCLESILVLLLLLPFVRFQNRKSSALIHFYWCELEITKWKYSTQSEQNFTNDSRLYTNTILFLFGFVWNQAV